MEAQVDRLVKKIWGMAAPPSTPQRRELITLLRKVQADPTIGAGAHRRLRNSRLRYLTPFPPPKPVLN